MNINAIISGFEPFLEHTANPSEQAARALDGQTIGGARIRSLVLPVAFGEDTKILLPAIDEIHPELVISLGLMASAKQVEVEMFAVNHKKADARSPFEPIDPNGPAAYFATLDPFRIAASVTAETGVPAAPHGYAGSYLCNHIMYRVLRHQDLQSSSCKAGFIHLPFAKEDAPDNPDALPLAKMIDAIKTAIETSVEAL